MDREMDRERPGATFTLTEMSNTYGCTWSNPGGGKVNYGFGTFPSASGLWLEVVSGDAVRQLLSTGLGSVVSERRGAYYGKVCRTIRVNLDELEATCRAYWDNANKQDAQRDTRCHYCGLPANDTDFFGEPVCRDCQ